MILVCNLHELYFDLSSWKYADSLRVNLSCCYILLYHEQIIGVDKGSCDVDKNLTDANET